ncbi:uncharacterized small protein (DUF1192 family) [Methylohalomonas lacus]|uniref:Uncharacterized small protein (DUF1192 family) n=1 Tax=Methylohalomonas lacus TaxID=398773 RepID=A0AAE3HMB4_9GAMM|nr:DUF2681 domain-containing protein [Methylohalomonas lacus]MCS3904475.1 uncharacterized small protein (DUF1192 family) [Methylohalomonas lacus]
MNQQINLYQPMFRRQEKVFSAVTMVQIVGVILLVLTAFYAYSWWSLQPFEQELAKVKQEQNRLQKELVRLEAQAPDQSKSQLLEDEIERLNREVEQKQRVAELISGKSLGNRDGFAPLLEGLARQHMSGLWLTHVSLEHGGKRLSLSGKAISSELIPQYIQQLSREKVFAGLGFNVLEIKRSDSEPGVVEFDLATRINEQSKG